MGLKANYGLQIFLNCGVNTIFNTMVNTKKTWLKNILQTMDY